MKVTNQYIVKENGKWQILFQTDEAWFITDNGAFNQRDMSISEIRIEQVKEILSLYKRTP